MPQKRAQKQSTTKKTVKQSKQSKAENRKNENASKEENTTTKGKETSKMTLCTMPSVSTPRPQRRPGRPPSGKRLLSREMPGKVRSAYRRSLDPCDNSNDSGLGSFDHHMDPHHHTIGMTERLAWSSERAEAKKPRMDIKLENEDVNDGYCFPDSIRQCKDNISLIRTAPSGSAPSLSITNNVSSTSGRVVPRCIPLSSRQTSTAPMPLTTQLSSTSRYSDVSLMIVKQPEQQHRARYQTEGSRGAVKDREGNGFPIVQLSGYYKPATLQVYIGTDVGKVAPHMFYQACKVSGKNSTPCAEKKIEGTCVIELALDPSKEMSATCDCVGILKERNVDVEHRFPDQLGNRSKKKSTRCRMIFRTTITHDNGTQETLQVCSQPIVCTQPPGVPEICKKSLTSCPASGGLELFVLGKNFLKDTKVFFQQFEEGHIRWEQSVVPDKEYLQQTHFVCVVPPYCRPDITEPVSVRLCVISSGKTSESHQFVYTPVNGAMPSVHMEPQHPQPAQFFKGMLWQSATVSKREKDLDMMPPPESSMVPMASRRPSVNLHSSNEIHSPPLRTLKQEFIDESSQSSVIDPIDVHQERYRHISESSLDVHHGDSNISMINDNSMDMIHHSSVLSHINENSNLSIANDDSVDVMVCRNSINRSLLHKEESVDILTSRSSLSRSASATCESSLDVNISTSDVSSINEDSSCSTTLHGNNSVVSSRMVLPQPSIRSQSNISPSSNSIAVEKVMDLRMKMPLTNVTDFVTTASSLQRFGIEPTSAPLPTQSAQSVESYLTKIEAKPTLLTIGHNVKTTNMSLTNSVDEKMKMMSSQVISGTGCGLLTSTSQNLSHLGVTTSMTEAEPVFMSSQRTFLSAENEAINIVAKSEAAAIAEQTLVGQTNASTTITTMTTALERSIPTPINTEKLDALVNSTVESHIGSPVNSDSSQNDIITSKMSSTTSNSSEVIINTQDVMLNSQTSLMPPMMNNRLPSPVLSQQDSHGSANLSPEVILNSQISPTMMCHTSSTLSQETLLPSPNLATICQSSAAVVDTTLLPTTVTVTQQSLMATNNEQSSPESISSLHSPILTSEPEKAVLLEAAVDFLETQKKISELRTTTANIIMSTTTQVIPSDSLSQLQGTSGNNYVQSRFTTAPSTSNLLLPKTITQDQKSDFVMSLPVKEMTSVSAQNDKKNEDRMIPQAFTSLSENELINFINPSCFDQV